MSEETPGADMPVKDLKAALFAALAKAQGEFEPIEKNREVTIKPRDKAAYSFRYADLEEITRKTRPALSRNGLAMFQTMQHEDKAIVLTCMLVHADGGSISSSTRLPALSEADPKQFGALITYFRRYLAGALLGVSADDDLDQDGEGIGEGTGDAKGETPTPRTQSGRSNELPAYTEQAMDVDVPNVVKAIAAGRVTLDDAITQIKTRFTVSESLEAALRNAVNIGLPPADKPANQSKAAAKAAANKES